MSSLFYVYNGVTYNGPTDDFPYTGTVVAVDMQNLLAAFQMILVNTKVFTGSTCIVSLRRDIPQAAGTPFCLIKPMGFSANEGSVTGAGRFCTINEGEFRIRVLTRSNFDQAYTDKDLLTTDRTSSGTLALVSRIVNFLHGAFILDQNGNMMLEDVVKYVRQNEADREEVSQEWAGIDVYFSIRYQMKMDENLY